MIGWPLLQRANETEMAAAIDRLWQVAQWPRVGALIAA
jgi:hypothetical protein